MANINEILARAAALRDETSLNSIDPERAGSIMYDTLIALNELWLQQGAALVISKIYASVAAMEADTAPVSDLTGQPIRPGQIVVIASSDSDNGSIYRYNGTSSPSWSLVGEIGNLEPVDNLESDSTSLPLAARQGMVLDGKVSILKREIFGEDIEASDFVTSGVPYFLTDGTSVNNEYRLRTNLVPVTPGQKWQYVAINGTNILELAAFDANRELVIAQSVAGVSYLQTQTYVVPEGVYFIQCCSYTDSSPRLKYLGEDLVSNINWFDNLLQEAAQNTIPIKAIKNFPVLDFKLSTPFTFFSDGSRKEPSANRASLVVNASKGDIYKYSLDIGVDDMMIAAIDNTGKVIVGSSVVGTGSLSNGIYVVPEGAAFIVFCSYPASSDYRGLVSFIGNINEEINKINSFAVRKSFDFLSDSTIPYYGTDGNANYNEYRLKSGLKRVSPGDVCVYSIFQTANILSIAAFDINQNLILDKSLAGDSFGQVGIYVVPEGIYYIQVQGYKEDSLSLFAEIVSSVDKEQKCYGTTLDASHFAVLNSGATISEDGRSITTALNGYSNRAYSKLLTIDEDYILGVDITPLTADENGYFEHIIGKSTLTGILVGVGKDSSGTFMKVYKIQSETVQEPQRYEINGLDFRTNHRIGVTIRKRISDHPYYDVVITDCHGNQHKQEDLSLHQSGSGYVCVYSVVGTAKFENITYRYPYDAGDVKVMMIGHSFVEGMSLEPEGLMENRYSNLIKQELGIGKAIITALGGAGLYTYRLFYEQYLSQYHNIKYVFLQTGDNDENSQGTCDEYQTMNDAIIANGMIPIWATQTPDINGNYRSPLLDAYIRQHFRYVDVAQAFYDNDGNFTNQYHRDEYHPTVQGHLRIFNIIKAQAPDLFTCKDGENN